MKKYLFSRDKIFTFERNIIKFVGLCLFCVLSLFSMCLIFMFVCAFLQCFPRSSRAACQCIVHVVAGPSTEMVMTDASYLEDIIIETAL